MASRSSSSPKVPSPPGNLRDAQKAMTRDRLIAAARTLFARHGYAGARVEDIAAEAGASPATFYLHFKAKRDVALIFAEEVHQDGVAYYARLEEVAADASIDGINAWIAAAVGQWERLMPAVRIAQEAAAVDEQIRDANSSIFDLGVTSIEAGLVGSRRMERGEAHTRAILAMSLHEGFFNQCLSAGEVTDPERSIAILTSMWQAALVPAP